MTSEVVNESKKKIKLNLKKQIQNNMKNNISRRKTEFLNEDSSKIIKSIKTNPNIQQTFINKDE